MSYRKHFLLLAVLVASLAHVSSAIAHTGPVATAPILCTYTASFTQTGPGAGTLTWDALPGTGSYTVTVYNNSTTAVAQQHTTSDTFLALRNLSPGSYQFVITKGSSFIGIEDVVGL